MQNILHTRRRSIDTTAETRLCKRAQFLGPTATQHTHTPTQHAQHVGSLVFVGINSFVYQNRTQKPCNAAATAFALRANEWHKQPVFSIELRAQRCAFGNPAPVVVFVCLLFFCLSCVRFLCVCVCSCLVTCEQMQNAKATHTHTHEQRDERDFFGWWWIPNSLTNRHQRATSTLERGFSCRFYFTISDPLRPLNAERPREWEAECASDCTRNRDSWT